MKDIFFIICPISNEIIGLSNQKYGVIPASIKENWQFILYEKKLSFEEKRPVFKIFEKVEKKEFELIYEMYLGLFKSWNVKLYNFNYPIGFNSLRSALEKPYHSHKYLINDLGYIHECLSKIYSEYSCRNYVGKDHELLRELIFMCGIHCILGLSWNQLKKCTYSQIHKQLEPYESNLPSYLEKCSSDLNVIRFPNHQNNIFFKELSKHKIGGILRALNFLFASIQAQIVLNKVVWEHVDRILGYLMNKKEYNRNYQTIDFFNQLVTTKENHVTLNEFQQILKFEEESIDRKYRLFQKECFH